MEFFWPPQAGSSNFIVSVSDTNSIDLTVTANDLTADLKLSAGAATGTNLKITNSIETDGLLSQVPRADGSTDGYLDNADWTTFNDKQPAGNYITALTGDGTAAGPGSVALTLATVNSNVGSFGDATSVSTVTVNAKGLVTAAANTAIQITESQVDNLVSDLAGKQPTGNYITALTGDVTATGPGSVASTLATVNSNVGSFGSATEVATFTVNAKGLTTAAANTSIQIAESQVTNLVSDLAAKQSTTLTSAHILVGNGSNVATDVAMSGDIAITNTGATSYSGIVPLDKGGSNKNMTAVAGGVVYTDADSMEVSAAGTSGQYLKSNGTSAPAFTSFTSPTIQAFTTGSGTYTTPAGALYIRVRMVGAGGGGGGSGTASQGTGQTGGISTFGTTLLVANGGVGAVGGGGAGGAGGTASLGTGPIGTALTGGSGCGGTSLVAFAAGGQGGSSPFGGAGAGGNANGAGGGGVHNTGGGGGGGGNGTGASQTSGPGGGSGGYVDAIITSPSATYAYAVGAASLGGTAGTLGFAGGAGGRGYIEVTEYYN